MRLLAIDPGSTDSAWVLYDTQTRRPAVWAKRPNPAVREIVQAASSSRQLDALAVEMVASYGMPVGASVFDTCVEIGRLIECWTGQAEPLLVFRSEVKQHLCGSQRAKDSNIRQALIDRYGGKETAIGRKASPGPLYGMKADIWQALAVAVTATETRLGLEEAA